MRICIMIWLVYPQLLSLLDRVLPFFLSSGYPLTRGYQITVLQSSTEEESVVVRVSINDGTNTWALQAEAAKGIWVNVAFTWNPTDTTGLSLFIDGVIKGQSVSLDVSSLLIHIKVYLHQSILR